MKNWKLIVFGGLVFYLVVFLMSFVMGPLIHEGVLKDTYKAYSQFWLPELNQDPPDIGALMPLWITTGILWGFVVAGVYVWARKAMNPGPGWKKGLFYGIGLALLNTTQLYMWSGVMNLPANIWAWWAIDGAVTYLIGCTALGLVAKRIAPMP